jgi:arsenate reductase
MILQIFGRKKSSDTRKAIRFCKERSVEYQFIDLSEQQISPGELSHVLRYVDKQDLVDTHSRMYKKSGYDYLDYDPVEEVLEHPLLMRLPLLRVKNFAAVGFDEDILQGMIDGNYE